MCGPDKSKFMNIFDDRSKMSFSVQSIGCPSAALHDTSLQHPIAHPYTSDIIGNAALQQLRLQCFQNYLVHHISHFRHHRVRGSLIFPQVRLHRQKVVYTSWRQDYHTQLYSPFKQVAQLYIYKM